MIVVDDASSNDNVEKLRSLIRNYPTFEFFFDKEGGGAGHARNIGLSRAQGEWILFADADDYFEKSIWDRLDKIVDNDSSDVIYFKCNGVYEDEVKSKRIRGSFYNNLIDNFLSKKIFAEQKLRTLYVTPWGKLFRSEFVKSKNILFENTIASNDVMFVTKAGTMSQRISAYSILMYNVTSRPDSLTTTKSIALLKCRLDVAIRKHKYIKTLCYSIVDTSFLYFWFFFLILGNRVDLFSALFYYYNNKKVKKQECCSKAFV